MRLRDKRILVWGGYILLGIFACFVIPQSPDGPPPEGEAACRDAEDRHV